MKQCRACGHKHMTSIMHLDQVPVDVQRLVTLDQLNSKTTTEIEIYQCNGCGLVQSAVSLESTYYDDYLMSTTFSSQLTNYLGGLATEFVSKYNLHDAHVIDIGCGDGAFMLPFVEQGISVVGIEPSERSRQAAQEKGLVVHAGYVSADSAISSGPFDAFVCRQVLEHVDNIAEFLTGIRKNLRPDAVGIIEVPRLEKAQEDRRFYDFFPDHVNYFSLDTLSTTLSLHGFEVLELKSTMNDEYNVAIVRRREPHNFSVIQQQRCNLSTQINQLLADAHADNKRTAIWGTGAKGLSIMSVTDSQYLDMVVDSDPNKIGRYVPVNQKQIQDPQSLITDAIDVIIISAVAYQKTILAKLQNLNYTGRVYLIDQTGLKECACSTY